jgi:IclR family transcriptional regulator, acetate operon repressor
MQLNRIMMVLEYVAAADRPVSATELHKLTEIPKPTCYRALQKLAENGFIEDLEATGRYSIGRRLRAAVMQGHSNLDVCEATRPFLKEAAGEYDEAVFLSRIRNNGVEIIHVEAPANSRSGFIHPGLGFRPIHACSCSKAILAFAGSDLLTAAMKTPMKQYTDKTFTEIDQLKRDIEEVKVRGYAECLEEIQTGVSSVAVPIFMANVGTIFSIGCIGPVSKFNATRRAEIGASLLGLVGRISLAIQMHAQVAHSAAI